MFFVYIVLLQGYKFATHTLHAAHNRINLYLEPEAVTPVYVPFAFPSDSPLLGP